MKIRQGFVSNSSSSSFVVGKAYMTDEQVDKFSMFVAKMEDIPFEDGGFYLEETGIYENDYYFHGDVSHRDERKITDFLLEIGVKLDYVTFDE